MSARSDYISMPELFAEQFTPDGDGFIYRRSSTGEAKRVSAAERDDFLTTFIYRRQYLLAATFACALLLFFFLAIQTDPSDQANTEIASFVYCIALLGAFSLVQRAIWLAPVRELKSRPPIAAALPREEALRIHFARISYGQVILFGFVGMWLSARVPDHWGKLRPFDMLLLAVSATCIFAAIIQAFRKWRIERPDQNPAITSINAGP